jgi:hypothetical protein
MGNSGNEMISFEKEYGRVLLALRVTATVSILLSSTWCGYQHHNLRGAREVFENMVEGGMSAMPAFTRAAFEYESMLSVGAALCALICLALVWVCGRRLSTVIYAGLAGAVVPLLTGFYFSIAFSGPLQEVITKFHR